MRLLALFVAFSVASATSCQKDKKGKGQSAQSSSSVATPPRRANDVPPPMPVKAPPSDAQKIGADISYKVLAKGSGDKPGKNDTVKLHYSWWKTTGQLLRSTRRSNNPHTFKLGQIAPAWRQLLTSMTPGEKVMAWVPMGQLSKGMVKNPSEVVAMEIELIEVTQAPKPPDQLATPPADAVKAKSGVAYKVLQNGAGSKKAKYYDDVTFSGLGWDAQGNLFWETPAGKPTKVNLLKQPDVISLALQELKEGDKALVWVPESLNTGGRFPKGPLTLELTVSKIADGVKPPDTPDDVAAPPANAKKTAKGVFYKELVKGKGQEKPSAKDTVKVHYSGWTTDGKLFDSSVMRNSPASFPLGKVIAGWTDGLQVMNVGDKTRFWIPEALAYKGQPHRPKGMLVFDVELLEIEKAPEPPETPKDVAAPPKDAKKTQLGVHYKFLKKGKGGKKPGPTDRVTVHYSGWTTDGKMFDSSVTRGKKSTFGLNQVIAGWTDGLQVMSVGDKVRFWIPEEHAYKGSPGKPQGMLVFDVELFGIQ